MMKKLFLTLCFLLCASPVWAVTTNLADCEYATVNTAIGAAAAGDTITCPTSATWSSHLQITKGITLQGIGNPTITSNYDASVPGTTATPGNFLIDYSPDATERTADNLFRITGFTFDLNNKCGGIGLFNTTTTPSTRIRIDHNTIQNATNAGGAMRAVMFQGHLWGVVDANVFSGNAKHVDSYGDNADTWDNFTFAFGSSANVYIENNTFTISTTAHSSGQGGRYVARYNTYAYTGSVTLSPWFDAHGNQLSGVYAAMGTEVYNNLITSTNNRDVLIHDGRGGKHLVYKNNAVTTGTVTLRVREEYADDCSPTTNEQSEHVSGSYYWGNTKNTSTAVSCTDGGSCVTTTCNYGVYNGQERACYTLAENTDFFNSTYSYAPYTCPHPLTGLAGSCDSSIAGTGGYNLGNMTLGTGTGFKFEGASFSLQ